MAITGRSAPKRRKAGSSGRRGRRWKRCLNWPWVTLSLPCPARLERACPQAPTPLASNRGPNSGIAVAALRSEPWRPTGAIPCVFVIFIDRGHVVPPQCSVGALPVSQPPMPVGRAPGGWWFEHHAPLGLRIASKIATHARPVEGAVAPRSRLFINREDVYGSDRRISLSI